MSFLHIFPSIISRIDLALIEGKICENDNNYEDFYIVCTYFHPFLGILYVLCT